jgi:hypothetical protein
MLTPEVVELCQQASVEQDIDRLLYLVTEINRLMAVADIASRKGLASTHERDSECQLADSEGSPQADS